MKIVQSVDNMVKDLSSKQASKQASKQVSLIVLKKSPFIKERNKEGFFLTLYVIPAELVTASSKQGTGIYGGRGDAADFLTYYGQSKALRLSNTLFMEMDSRFRGNDREN
ncbi:MAG: hypothetical protein HY746_08085 [Elusimicrobia bacterium]|nr:hypothetical protein [Elusimicrobiota bacterium]